MLFPQNHGQTGEPLIDPNGILRRQVPGILPVSGGADEAEEYAMLAPSGVYTPNRGSTVSRGPSEEDSEHHAGINPNYELPKAAGAFTPRTAPVLGTGDASDADAQDQSGDEDTEDMNFLDSLNSPTGVFAPRNINSMPAPGSLTGAGAPKYSGAARMTQAANQYVTDPNDVDKLAGQVRAAQAATPVLKPQGKAGQILSVLSDIFLHNDIPNALRESQFRAKQSEWEHQYAPTMARWKYLTETEPKMASEYATAGRGIGMGEAAEQRANNPVQPRPIGHYDENAVDESGNPVTTYWEPGFQKPTVVGPRQPRNAPEGDRPLSDAETRQFNGAFQDRYQVLNPGKPLPSEFTLGPGATEKDFDRIDRVLQGTEAAAGTKSQREQTQSSKDEEAVFAFDPKTKQRVYTTRGEAKANGYTGAGKAVAEGDVQKEEMVTRQLNDVQLNVSRYRKALNAVQADIPKDHVQRMTQIIALASQLDREGGGQGIVGQLSMGMMPTATSQLQQGELASAWNYLTPQEQEIVTGYFRAKGSLLAYQRALTGTGRTSQVGLQLEMPNIPEPYVGATVANKRLNAFQENIDTASKGSVQFPWLDSHEDVRQGIEGNGAGAEERKKTGPVPTFGEFMASRKKK